MTSWKEDTFKVTGHRLPSWLGAYPGGHGGKGGMPCHKGGQFFYFNKICLISGDAPPLRLLLVLWSWLSQ